MYSHMIPISIYVAVEILKLLQYRRIQRFLNEPDLSHQHAKIQVRNMDIIDNLAQINLLLSDKTGTLTKHKFFMISCFINQTMYGEVKSDHKNVKGITSEVCKVLEQQTDTDDFFTCIALC